MPSTIQTITTPFIFNISVNCYLVRIQNGFILIDTAKAGQRRTIEAALAKAGCQPGNLKLIILTHGDFDHCGNAAYLSKKYGAPVAMHPDDAGMVERGDMFWNRKQPNPVMRAIVGLLFHLNAADQFKPDVFIQQGDNLAQYGFDAQVIELPGHAKGNIGLLTAENDLFCGDLLANTSKPQVWTIVDDQAAMQASVAKLNGLPIQTVYPGHGQPFLMEQFWRASAS